MNYVNLLLSSQKSPLWLKQIYSIYTWDLQYFSTSKTTKSPNKAGKALPKQTVSPWLPMGHVSICSRGRGWLCRSPSSRRGTSGSVQSQQCSAEPRASPALLGTIFRHKTSQTWQVQYHTRVGITTAPWSDDQSSRTSQEFCMQLPGDLHCTAHFQYSVQPSVILQCRADHEWLTLKAKF